MAFEAWKERAEELETEVHALALAVRSRRTPFAAKVVVALLVAYAVSPIDPIPDVIPVLGYLDELVVLPVGVAIAVWLIPDDLMSECRRRAGDDVEVGRVRWLVAALVVLVWFVIAAVAVRTVSGWP